MRITCYYDNECDMGYIYLKPPRDEIGEYQLSKNEIANYVDIKQIRIPYVTDEKLASHLDQLPIAKHTFKDDYEKGYDTEYGNDMNEHGYLTGIELTLSLKGFIELVESQAFKVYKTEWRNREYNVITFDHLENVFSPENVIYKMTEDEDVFVIVKLEKPEKLGYLYTNDDDQKRPIALFKALISARDDIYPLEYLLKQEFYLAKDKFVPIDFEPYDSEAIGLEYWESMTEEQRQLIINDLCCSHCSSVINFSDCKLEGDGFGVLIMGSCNNCGHDLAKYVE